MEIDPTVFAEEETEYDLLFPVIPLEDDPASPESDGFELVDDIADAEAPYVGEPDASAIIGDDYAFDWDEGEFFVGETGGDALRVEGDEAVVEWAQKALRTRKGEYPIYPQDYGCDLQRIIGQALPDNVLAAEVERTVTDCLLFNPRISEVIVEEISPRGVEDGLFVTALIYIDGSDEPAVVSAEVR